MSTCPNHTYCQTTALNTAEELCQEKNLRLTKNRKAVLELIWQSHRPIKAYDALAQMQQQHPDKYIPPPTIYRALEFLLKNGLIHRIDSLNAFIGCAHPNSHDDCYFFICRDCGTANEYCTPELKNAISHAVNEQNFKHDTTVLEVIGQCENCNKGKEL